MISGVVITAVLALLVFAYWDNYIRPSREVAVRAGNRSYDTTYLARRVRARLNEPAGLLLQTQQIATLPPQIADEVISEEVALQKAGELGVSVSGMDIDTEIAAKLRAVTAVDEQGQLTYSPAFEAVVKANLQQSGLTLAQYRRGIHGQVLQREIRKKFEAEIPDTLPAAKTRLIAVADEAKAKEIKQRLDAGGDFAQIAATESSDTTRTTSGLKDWTPKGGFAKELDGAIFTLPTGQISDPISAAGKWWIVKVEERSENREVTAEQKTALAGQKYGEWLEESRKALNAKNYLLDSVEMQSWVLDHSGAVEAAQERQQQQRQAPPASQPQFPVSTPVVPPAAQQTPPPPPDNAPVPTPTTGGTP